MTGETNLQILIASMQPLLNEGEYIFCSLFNSKKNQEYAVMFFKEREGATFIFPKQYADNECIKYSSTFAWITLQVHSSLEAVGLTAAFANALAKGNVSCNVVAGFYHDHIFVQYEKRHEAVSILEDLAKNTI